ncbi:hypothetical protein ID867_14825 [Streptomyces parvulus]|nr:hypothetical protein [Streptomyces parvulus]
MRRTARALSTAVLASAALGVFAAPAPAQPGVPPPPAGTGRPVAEVSPAGVTPGAPSPSPSPAHRPVVPPPRPSTPPHRPSTAAPSHCARWRPRRGPPPGPPTGAPPA